jgi:serine/threonine protein kinase
MEYLEGGDLQRYIGRDVFPETEALAISRQLLEGLKFMHRNGFAHRDLKPKVYNIYVSCTCPAAWPLL